MILKGTADCGRPRESFGCGGDNGDNCIMRIFITLAVSGVNWPCAYVIVTDRKVEFGKNYSHIRIPKIWIGLSTSPGTMVPKRPLRKCRHTAGRRLRSNLLNSSKAKVKVKILSRPKGSRPACLGVKLHLAPKTRFLLHSDC